MAGASASGLQYKQPNLPNLKARRTFKNRQEQTYHQRIVTLHQVRSSGSYHLSSQISLVSLVSEACCKSWVFVLLFVRFLAAVIVGETR